MSGPLTQSPSWPGGNKNKPITSSIFISYYLLCCFSSFPRAETEPELLFVDARCGLTRQKRPANETSRIGWRLNLVPRVWRRCRCRRLLVRLKYANATHRPNVWMERPRLTECVFVCLRHGRNPCGRTCGCRFCCTGCLSAVNQSVALSFSQFYECVWAGAGEPVWPPVCVCARVCAHT